MTSQGLSKRKAGGSVRSQHDVGPQAEECRQPLAAGNWQGADLCRELQKELALKTL